MNEGSNIVVNGIKFQSRQYAGWNQSFYPYFDDQYDLGVAAGSAGSGLARYYWDNIYQHGTIIKPSDRRLKNTIEDSSLGLEFIEKLRPVSYKLNTGKKSAILGEDDMPLRDENEEILYTSFPGIRTHQGLIAQEVKEVMDDLGLSPLDFAGWGLEVPEEEESQQSVMLFEFIAPLIKAVQELSAKVKELESNQ
jgi:hypothetical protein